MPVELTVIKEGRLLQITYSDPLAMSDIVEKFEEMQRLHLDHAAQPVHAIFDLTGVKRPPTNALSQSAGLIKKPHPKGGEIILVTKNSFMTALANIFKRLVRQYKVSVFETLDAARDYGQRITADQPIAEPMIKVL